MALTEDEIKKARAYNIGYMLSQYEPRLLNKIIKGNPKNDFVKVMQTARDHQELHVNIPRKDYSPEFKNGFYNGRALLEHEPKVYQAVINSKGVNQNYKKGLEAAKREFEVREIQKRMQQVRTTAKEVIRNNSDFKNGFNVGYKLGKNHREAIAAAIEAGGISSQFATGLKEGLKEFNAKGTLTNKANKREANPTLSSFISTQAAINKLHDKLGEPVQKTNSEKASNANKLPKWLSQKESKTQPANSQNKSNKKGRDHDR